MVAAIIADQSRPGNSGAPYCFRTLTSGRGCDAYLLPARCIGASCMPQRARPLVMPMTRRKWQSRGTCQARVGAMAPRSFVSARTSWTMASHHARPRRKIPGVGLSEPSAHATERQERLPVQPLCGNVRLDKGWLFAYCSAQSLTPRGLMVDRYGVVPRKRRTCGLHDPASGLGGVSALSGLDGLLSARAQAEWMEDRRPGSPAPGDAGRRDLRAAGQHIDVFGPGFRVGPRSR
jgi:hypothetical protein